MTQIPDAQNTLVPTRQAWQTPRLIDLSAQQTESGKLNPIETSISVIGTTPPFVGPTSGAGS